MSRTKTYAKRGLGLAVTGVSIYLVIPSLTSTFSSWPELKNLRSGSLIIMSLLTLLSLVCFWILLGLALRSKDWGLMASSQLASAAIARILPGGSATATAVQYNLLNDGGISKSAAGTGLTVATLLNFAVLFSLPVFAVPAIVSGTSVDAALVNGAIVAAICFVAAAIVGGLFFMWDRPLAALGNAIDAIARRLHRSGHESGTTADRLLESRNLIRAHLSRSWYWVVLSSFGKWGFDYLALVMAVRGTGHDDTSSVLLLAFVTASLLGRIPLTPGGLGFVEAGLTGTLVMAGVSTGDAVLATLAYRLVSYWIPIPLGGIAYGLQRLRLHRRGVEVPTFGERLENEDVAVEGPTAA